MAEVKELQSENESLKSKAAREALGDVMDQVVEVKGVKLLAAEADGVDMNGLRDLGDQLKEKIGEGVIVLASAKDGKVNLVAMATDTVMKQGAHAGNLIKGIAALVGGARVAADGLSLPAHGKAAYKEGSRHPPRGHRRHAGGAGVRAGDQGVQPEGAVYRRPEPQAGRGGAGHHPGRAVHRLRGHGGAILPKAGHRHHRPHGGDTHEPRRPGTDPVSDVPYRRHPCI